MRADLSLYDCRKTSTFHCWIPHPVVGFFFAGRETTVAWRTKAQERSGRKRIFGQDFEKARFAEIFGGFLGASAAPNCVQRARKRRRDVRIRLAAAFTPRRLAPIIPPAHSDETP
jgi:hypothetical protein